MLLLLLKLLSGLVGFVSDALLSLLRLRLGGVSRAVNMSVLLIREGGESGEGDTTNYDHKTLIPLGIWVRTFAQGTLGLTVSHYAV